MSIIFTMAVNAAPTTRFGEEIVELDKALLHLADDFLRSDLDEEAEFVDLTFATYRPLRGTLPAGGAVPPRG